MVCHGLLHLGSTLKIGVLEPAGFTPPRPQLAGGHPVAECRARFLGVALDPSTPVLFIIWDGATCKGSTGNKHLVPHLVGPSMTPPPQAQLQGRLVGCQNE